MDRELTVTSGDASLHVEVRGEGRPLLSVSGSGSALADRIPGLYPELTGFCVADWDHRGLGRSTDADAPRTMADFAADGLAVADALGWDRFALLGVSFGGMVAQELAVTAPGRVTRMVLCCTSSGGTGGSSYPLHEPPDPQTSLRIFDTRLEVQAVLGPMLAQRTSLPREPGYTRELEARAGHDVWDRLPLLDIPTLVASGQFDGLAPPENGAALASRIPGARFETFDGGHGFLMQDPTAWPRVIAFLNGET